jgi:hypothetical protein
MSETPTLTGVSANRTVFDAADPDVNVYRLLTALVVPRSIAWVSTLSPCATTPWSTGIPRWRTSSRCLGWAGLGWVGLGWVGPGWAATSGASRPRSSPSTGRSAPRQESIPQHWVNPASWLDRPSGRRPVPGSVLPPRDGKVDPAG